ncbi:unnamed protein product [Camellia sinensis]
MHPWVPGMTETIDELTKHLSLAEEEQDTIVVQEFLTKSVEEKAWLCLIGKLLTPRAFSVEAMKFTLMAIWKPIKGLYVKIDCKDTSGELKTRGVGKLDDEEKFRVSLPLNILEKYGNLKEECFAHLHSASTAPCPAHSGSSESSKVVFKSKTARKHTFSPAGILKFSPVVEDIPSKPKHSSQLN